MAKGKNNADRELEAMGLILAALEGMDGEAVQRVFDYVFSRLSLPTRSQLRSAQAIQVTGQVTSEQRTPRKPSIRDLKDEKQPESSNQMAALVAYYLSELAEPQEQKQAITSGDVEKYFKQAGFKLPKSLPQTLPNAAAAGYFDGTGNGQYRLNAVGYNLVVHGLPRTVSEANPKRRQNRPRRAAKRKAKA